MSEIDGEGGESIIVTIRRGVKSEITEMISGLESDKVVCSRNTTEVEFKKYSRGEMVIRDCIFQGFKKDEVTTEVAIEIAGKFAHFFVPGYELIVYTHDHGEGINNHIVIYSEKDESKEDYLAGRPDLYAVLNKFDEICLRYGLSVKGGDKKKGSVFGLSESDLLEKLKERHIELEALYMNFLLENDDSGVVSSGFEYVKKVRLLNELGLMGEEGCLKFESKVREEFLWKKGLC